MDTGYVITHPEFGIFLGECMGMGFWSRLDPVGQSSAVVFPDEDSARDYLTSWDRPEAGCSFVEVEITKIDTDGALSADMAACVRAGLPPWDPDARPTGVIH